MLDLLLQTLTAGGLIPGFGLQQNDDCSVSISIPRDHPKAGKLLALANELASRQVLDSGIVVDYGNKPIRDERLMNLLREIVDVDSILVEAARRHQEEKRTRFTKAALASLGEPRTAATIAAGLLQTDHEALPLVTDDKDRLASILRDRNII